MKVPATQIIILDFPVRELSQFMKALCSALPGAVWLSEVFHNDECPLSTDKALAEDACRCVVTRIVIVKRLQPTVTTSGNGGGR